MHKQTVVDQIEIVRNGQIQIRMAKEVVDDDGSVLSREWHRSAVAPGEDIDAQMAAVNEHLTSGLNYPAVSANDIARIHAVADVTWTQDVIAAYRESQIVVTDFSGGA